MTIQIFQTRGKINTLFINSCNHMLCGENLTGLFSLLLEHRNIH